MRGMEYHETDILRRRLNHVGGGLEHRARGGPFFAGHKSVAGILLFA